MTKSNYEKPEAITVLIGSTEVLCGSKQSGGLDDVTRNEIDWSWDQE